LVIFFGIVGTIEAVGKLPEEEESDTHVTGMMCDGVNGTAPEL